MLPLPRVGLLDLFGDLRRLGVVHRWSGKGAEVVTSAFFGRQSWNALIPRYLYVAMQNVFVKTIQNISFPQTVAFAKESIVFS